MLSVSVQGIELFAIPHYRIAIHITEGKKCAAKIDSHIDKVLEWHDSMNTHTHTHDHECLFECVECENIHLKLC